MSPKDPSIILGIDTSCDETSISVLKNENEVLANIVSSQIELHKPHGGVVPEIASRAHLEKITQIFEEALKVAGITINEITGIAVTTAPGLIGCLLVGLSFAKALAYARGLPLTGVHHLKGHLMSAFLEHEETYPFLGLIVSGGHTALYYVRSFHEIELIGSTVDDAAGEAYDKVAKVLGLGYPGGPLVDKMAATGDPKVFSFTRARVKKGKYFFSFSGLKTAVWQLVSKNKNISEDFKINLCASFQEEVVGALIEKIEWALVEYPSQALVVAGGVACNSRLREKIKNLADARKIPCYIPSPLNCTDNAAMIAYVGARQLKEGKVAKLDLNAQASVPLNVFYEKL